jgi:hypothetical protein
MRLTRMSSAIKETERFVACVPEKDSLADVLRRTGLMGVKVRCGVRTRALLATPANVKTTWEAKERGEDSTHLNPDYS